MLSNVKERSCGLICKLSGSITSLPARRPVFPCGGRSLSFGDRDLAAHRGILSGEIGALIVTELMARPVDVGGEGEYSGGNDPGCPVRLNGYIACDDGGAFTGLYENDDPSVNGAGSGVVNTDGPAALAPPISRERGYISAPIC